MKTASIAIRFLLLLAAVVALSAVSVKLWSDVKEELPEQQEMVLEPGMTVGQFGAANHLEKPALRDLFGLQGPDDLNRPVTDFVQDQQALSAKLLESSALEAEYQSKNWIKIPVKFGLWFVYLGMIFVLMRRKRITPGLRRTLYLAAVFLFGVVLSADPSPMGTVKDAIHLFGATGAIFPPRMIALSVFLAIVILANKYICAWGCQFGTLQDAIFRFNRTAKDTKSLTRQYKIPFVVSNSVRVLFFLALTFAAFAWALDITELYDPFKIFKPQVLGAVGIVVISLLVVGSLFVYRPWCTLFCPFGLVGWLAEKVSITRIQVDYDKCIACQACARACPSTVMEAILKRDKATIPDCFSCGTCINVCPSDAISFKAGKRALPPADKFKESPADSEA